MNEHDVGNIDLISYFTGDIDEEKRVLIGKHVESCDQCRLYIENLKKSKADFLSKFPVPRVSESEKIRKFTIPKYVYALAATFVLAVSLGRVFWNDPYPTERIKGETSLELFVQTSEGAVEKREKPYYYCGERIQFVYSCAGDSNFALMSIDEQGKVFVYFPSEGSMSIPLDVGAGIPLPNSIVLDNYVGKELFVAFFSAKPFNVEALKTRLSNTYLRVKQIDSLDLKISTIHIEKKLIVKQEAP